VITEDQAGEVAEEILNGEDVLQVCHQCDFQTCDDEEMVFHKVSYLLKVRLDKVKFYKIRLGKVRLG
jgi:hypothetical protein